MGHSGPVTATGSALPPPPLPSAFGVTRASLHLLAARVLGAARYAAVGRMGLEVVPGGFATPEFDGRQLLIVDATLRDGTRSHPITTLADACAFADVDPNHPPHPVLDLPADPSAPLVVDPEAARVHARWLAFTQSLLESVQAHASPTDDATAIQLWPEHFDLALETGPPGARANVGGSPGDDAIDEPYLYVGPHDHRQGPFWNAPFGAALTYGEIRGGADPVAFFDQARAILGAS
jgi:hypothetical protein